MRVLVVCAHADDEVLGMGGTIALHSKRGDDVRVMILADGETSRIKNKHNIAARKTMAKNVMAILNIKQYEFCDFPDNKLDSIALLDIIQKIEQFAHGFKPDLVYTHFGGDLNIDHQRTYQACITAFRPTPIQTVKTILTFEVLSSTDWFPHQSFAPFLPTVFNNIEKTFKKKMQALQLYSAEMRESPHSRSFENVETLAKHRGMTQGVRYAEAFMIERAIDPFIN